MKIVYILEFDYGKIKHNYIHKSYPELIKYDLKRLTPLESLVKSIKSVRKFTDFEIVLIADYLPKELKDFKLKFQKLDLDPYSERLHILQEISGDVLFVEHDIFFTRDIFPRLTKSWVNAGSSSAPYDFHGDLFFINHNDKKEFFDYYFKIYNMKFQQNEKPVYAANAAFKHIQAIREYDILKYPQWNSLDFVEYGFHTHYDF